MKPDEKPPMDYMGRYRSRPIAYEAKHTKEKRIDLKAVDENQTEWLDDWAVDPQAITFVMVSFNLQRFFAVPWEAWKVARQARELNRKDLGYGWFGPEICGVKAHYTWNATGMASISVEEMHPAWEVKVGGIAGLDYLKTIDRIF